MHVFVFSKLPVLQNTKKNIKYRVFFPVAKKKSKVPFLKHYTFIYRSPLKNQKNKNQIAFDESNKVFNTLWLF